MTFGALLIALGVLTFVRRYQRFREFAPGQKLFATAQSLVQFIPSRPARYGILTALLPCGFLWSALPQAAAIASPFGAGLGMLVFGIATTPALHVGPAIVQRIAKRWPRLGELLPPVIMILAGILAISRATGGLHHHHHG
jgi:sulfite exporter TauE/SafE